MNSSQKTRLSDKPGVFYGWFTTSPLTSGLVADLFGGPAHGHDNRRDDVVPHSRYGLGAYAGGITFELTGSYLSFFLVQGILELLAVSLAFAIKRQSFHKRGV